MKVDEAKKIADKQIEQLAAALREGKSETLRACLSVMSRFHRYSLRNQLLIFSQRPDAMRVAGFQTWKKLGRFVKKGEHGIAIMVPMPLKRAAEEAKEEKDEVIWFKAGYVFDVSQTEGEPLPEFASVAGDPGEHLERLKALVAARSVKLEYSSELGSADGLSKGGCIVLKEGLPAAEEFSVMVHELAHEILHHELSGEEKSKTVRETEAEAVAFVVSEASGLNTGTASSDYIQLYRGDAETLKDSLAAIQKAAALILASLLPEAE
jgi:antirestriction protein ArdC